MRMKNLVLFTYLIPLFLNAQESNLISCDEAYQDTSIIQDYYFAWRIQDVDDILFVAEGYSDGIDYSFYKINDKDSLDLIFRFNPVLIDSSNKSQEYYWGYPWDIKGIKIRYKHDGFEILSSYNHSIIRDGEIRIPEFQKILPVIFFTGISTQPTKLVEPIKDIKYRTFTEILKSID